MKTILVLGDVNCTVDTESYQAKAYRLFIQCMKEEMDQLSLQDDCGRYDLLEEVARQALDLMSVTRCKEKIFFCFVLVYMIIYLSLICPIVAQ